MIVAQFENRTTEYYQSPDKSYNGKRRYQLSSVYPSSPSPVFASQTPAQSNTQFIEVRFDASVKRNFGNWFSRDVKSFLKTHFRQRNRIRPDHITISTKRIFILINIFL